MKWSETITPGRILAAGAIAGGTALASLGLLEAIYHAPRQPSAWVYGSCLYAMLGLVYGTLHALLFGGRGRHDWKAYGDFVARVVRPPVAVLSLCAGGFLIWRDAWGESLAGAGVVGWLAVVALLVATWLLVRILSALARRLAARPLPVAALLVSWVVVGLWVSSGRPAAPKLRALPPPEGGQPAGRSQGIIVVVADALRADVLGAYGGAARTRHLDDLAAEAQVFTRAWSTSTWTRPAVASLLTGLEPGRHRAMHKASRLPADVPTLAQRLGQAGWNTAAVVTNVNLAPVFGLGRGFATYAYLGPEPFLGAPGAASRLFVVEVWRLLRLRFFLGRRRPENYYAPGEEINRVAVRYLEQLARKQRPFFLYLHYMEPHDPYFAHPYDGNAVARVENPRPPLERRDQMLKLYLQEVEHFDGLFGDLLSRVRELGLLERSLLVFTSDHGEEFADHGGFWHGTTLYEELLRVPLLVRWPGGGGAGRSAAPVSLLDLVPTVLRQAGLAGQGDLPGQAWQEPAAGGRILRAEVDHQGARLWAVLQHDKKLIHSLVDDPRGQPEWQLFDLENDPGERRNLAEQEPQLRQRLQELFAMEPRQPRGGESQVEIDDATEEQLRSLGYTE